MAVRDDWAPGEVLTADDLNMTFASKLPYAYGTATPTATDDGFVWFDENSTPPAPKFWDGAAFQAIGGGKILQIVRATDSTNRSTTSTAFVDASISVTITPQKNDSAILLIWSIYAQHSGANDFIVMQITDASNNAISGGESSALGSTGISPFIAHQTIIAYATPATTSATTYKGRFKANGAGTALIFNTSTTGQLFAIEVSA
jgi:hypothetical protein